MIEKSAEWWTKVLVAHLYQYSFYLMLQKVEVWSKFLVSLYWSHVSNQVNHTCAERKERKKFRWKLWYVKNIITMNIVLNTAFMWLLNQLYRSSCLNNSKIVPSKVWVVYIYILVWFQRKMINTFKAWNCVLPVAPFIIIPSDKFHKVVVQLNSSLCIKNAWPASI